MILGQISYLDCVVFLISLIPQLLYNVPFFDLISTGFRALPFLCLQLPYQYITERYLTPKAQRSPYVRQATYFQDLVIRIVRYAFAHIDASVGRVFFSKAVALPFVRFRMWRHGYKEFPMPVQEIQLDSEKSAKDVKGIWINHDTTVDTDKPDLVVYYCHGGGFSMGSNWFYLEFLIAWVHLLKASYRRPAIFALDYDLVPDSVWPKQTEQVHSGYEQVLSVVGDSSRICVAGDSAGGTLILSLLLGLAKNATGTDTQTPGVAALISPWCTIFTSLHRNTPSDFLNSNTLHQYGCQYAGSRQCLDHPLVSPGNCDDPSWWARASPSNGFCIFYGSEEVLGPDIKSMVARLREAKVAVSVSEEPGSIHAWPVVALFLGQTQEERQKGLKALVQTIKRSIEPE